MEGLGECFVSDLDAAGVAGASLSDEAAHFLEEILVEAGMVSSDQSQFGVVWAQPFGDVAPVGHNYRWLHLDSHTHDGLGNGVGSRT